MGDTLRANPEAGPTATGNAALPPRSTPTQVPDHGWPAGQDPEQGLTAATDTRDLSASPFDPQAGAPGLETPPGCRAAAELV